MGGRGSGGGRSSGGGSARANSSELKNKYENDNNAFRTEFMDKYHQMTDDELNKAYKSTQAQMNKARRNLDAELESFNKIREKFSNTDSNDKDFPKISDEFDRQVERVREARTLSDMKTQIHYLTLNEKNNVRGKQNSSDIKSMTDGQLNSYYNKSYKESAKARNRVENAKNAKTRAKYLKLYEEHSNNFNKAEAERDKRGLYDKNW